MMRSHLLLSKTVSDYYFLLNHADEHALRRHFRKRGGKTVLQNGLRKVQESITSLSEIRRMGALSIVPDGG